MTTATLHLEDQSLVEELAVEGMTPETIVEKLGWERKTLPMVRQIVRDMAEHENEEYRRELR